jgi:hypothetical protein
VAGHQSSAAAHLVEALVGISMLVVVISLNYAWFSTRWPGTYEFYSGGEDAFAARGYPVQIAVRLIVVICLCTPGLLIATAVLRAFVGGFRWPSERLRRRLLFGLAVGNLALVLVALTLPPRAMVVFPPFQLCRGGYIGLFAASLAALGAGCGLLLAVERSKSEEPRALESRAGA